MRFVTFFSVFLQNGDFWYFVAFDTGLWVWKTLNFGCMEIVHPNSQKRKKSQIGPSGDWTLEKKRQQHLLAENWEMFKNVQNRAWSTNPMFFVTPNRFELVIYHDFIYVFFKTYCFWDRSARGRGKNSRKKYFMTLFKFQWIYFLV